MTITATFTPITVTAETLTRITKEKKCGDLLALYMACVEITTWQGGNNIRATNSFLMKRLSWGEKRLTDSKKKLIEMDLLEPRTKKNKDGTIAGYYLLVKHVIQYPQNPGLDMSIIQYPQNPGLDAEGTSTNELNISTNKLKINKNFSNFCEAPKEKIKDFSFGASNTLPSPSNTTKVEKVENSSFGDLQSAKADCPPQFRDTPPASSTDTEPQSTSKKPKAKAKPKADEPKDEIKKQFYRVIKQYQLPVVNHKHINGWCDKLRTGLGANTAVHYLVRLQERDLRKEGAVEKFVPVLSRPLDILEKSGKIIAYYTRTKGKTIASEEVEDPIIAAGDGTFPAVWPKDKPEWNKEYEESGGGETRYFRGVVLDNTTIGEYCRIMEAREQLRNEENQDGAE